MYLTSESSARGMCEVLSKINCHYIDQKSRVFEGMFCRLSLKHYNCGLEYQSRKVIMSISST